MSWYLKILSLLRQSAEEEGQERTTLTLFAANVGVRRRGQKALKCVHKGVKEASGSTKKRRS